MKEAPEKPMNRTIADVHAFRDAAVADGWQIDATYGPHESIERAFRLTRNCDGFWIVSGIARPKNCYFTGNPGCDIAELCGWGPDGLSIDLPERYDFDAIKAAVTTCGNCGVTGIKPMRYGFAGRCCADCRPEMARRYEKPGWTK